MQQIAAWACENLPSHYDLLDVRCEYGTGMPADFTKDFEIVIEYANHLDPAMAGSMDAIKAHHAWSDPLIAKIRAEWPAWAMPIAFLERKA